MGSSMRRCGYGSPCLCRFNFKYAMPSNSGKEGPCIPGRWRGVLLKRLFSATEGTGSTDQAWRKGSKGLTVGAHCDVFYVLKGDYNSPRSLGRANQPTTSYYPLIPDNQSSR